MAANPAARATNRPTPVVVPVLAGAGSAILVFSLAVGLWALFGRGGDAPRGPGVEVPIVPPPVVNPGTVAAVPVVPAKTDAWWDDRPGSKLPVTVALLKQVVPAEQALFDQLGDKNEAARLDAYRRLTAKLPAMMRDPEAKNLLGRLLTEGYALEPAEPNAAVFCAWLVNQLPAANAEFAPTYRTDDLDRAFWALETGLDALTHPAMAARIDRSRHLAGELGKVLAIAIDPTASRADLKVQTEKVLARRCYRNLAPTAAKSLEKALMVREALIRKAPLYLLPAFRERIDIELAFQGLDGAKASWPAYRTLVQSCAGSKDPQVELQLAALYAQADPELARLMEPLLAGKWQVVANNGLKHVDKVKAIKKVLGVPEPVDALTQFDKLAHAALAGATAPPAKSQAILQEAARLAHASTLACALAHKDAGQASFEAWVARVPEIDQAAVTAQVADDDPKQPGGKKPADKVDVVGPGKPKVYQEQFRPGLFTRSYSVSLKGGKTYSIDLVSNTFDAYLFLDDARGKPIAQDDGSGGNLNARITFLAPVDATYRIRATSVGGNGVGPYRLSIQEAPPGFGGPMFGGPIFPGRPFPFPRNPFRPRPPFMMPGFPPPFQPGGAGVPMQPPAGNPDKVQPSNGGDTAERVSAADLARLLDKNPQKTRTTAFRDIAGKLKGSLAQKDMPARVAPALARYLLTRSKPELDDALPELAPLAKSRNLLLALADKVDQADAEQKASEATVGALAGQTWAAPPAGADWRLHCRKQLLLLALDGIGKHSKAAIQTSDALCELYKEQGVLLGTAAADLKKLTRPGQMLDKLIQVVTAKLATQDLSGEDKAFLEQVPRALRAAEFAADNDLERTALLQPIWARALALQLARQFPERAQELHRLGIALAPADRPDNVLVQLRTGEERLLRLWMAALAVK